MKKVKTSVIIAAANILAAASLSKMETSEKCALIRAAEAMRNHAEAYQSAVKAASEKMRPDGYGEIARKEEQGIDRTPEELEAVRKYNTEMSAFVEEELGREVERPYDAITEEALGRLADSNPELKLSELVALKEALVE